MRPSFSASVLWLTLPLLLPLLLASSPAQINAPPSSVTSPGFGGRPINGAPSSVTSVGPRGYSPNFRTGTPGTVPYLHRRGDGQHRRRRDENFFNSPLYYAVPVPYAIDMAPEDEAYSNDNSEYQGGPTVFDRRGSGERSYIPPVRDAAPAHESVSEDAPDPISDPEPAQQTLLVFKDGHKLEVGNYAIVGATLFDLTDGHARKIALAQLDLPATQKENDDRGVVFQVPPSFNTP